MLKVEEQVSTPFPLLGSYGHVQFTQQNDLKRQHYSPSKMYYMYNKTVVIK